MAIVICENCIKDFIPNRCGRGRFCSLLCYRKWMVGKPHGHKTCNGQESWNKGMKLPNQSGLNHHRYIADRTKLAVLSNGEEYRNSSASREWGKQVKNRDKWTCRIADNNCDGRLEAHHILPWSNFPELRYEVNNGITLCHFHHPRKRNDEVKLSPYFQELVLVKVK